MLIQFVESRVVKLQNLIANIAMHYGIDFVKNDGFHYNKLDETSEIVHEVLGYIFLVLECYRMELTTLKGTFPHLTLLSIIIITLICNKTPSDRFLYLMRF